MKSQKNKFHIPEPSLARLCKIYNLLEEQEEKGETYISSKDIGRRLGVGSHNIRKDIGYLGEPGTSGAGYDVSRLKAGIEEQLGYRRNRNACIIGMGALGSVIINYQTHSFPSFNIVAGFDSSINKIETMHTSIPVFPTYEIVEVARRMNIELAVITEPDRNLGKITERLRDGGIKGIINFTPVLLNSEADTMHVRNIDIVTEFRYLSALFTLGNR